MRRPLSRVVFCVALFLVVLLPRMSFAVERGNQDSEQEKFPNTARAENFTLYYGTEEALQPYAEAVLRLAPAVWTDLIRPYQGLEADASDPISIFLTADEELFREAAGFDPAVGFLAAASPAPDRILLLYPPAEWRPRYNLKETLEHELAHILLYRSGRFPRWFHEGYAMLTADPWTEEWQALLYGGILFDGAVPLEDLNERLTRSGTAVGAYARSFGFVAYLREQYGSETVFAIVRRVRSGEEFEAAFGAAVGIAPEAENLLFYTAARRRAWTAVLGETRFLFAGGAVLLTLAYLGARIRRREQLAAMEREEQKEDQERIEDFT